MTIFGHFFGNYINIFHKTEIQTIILRSLVIQNLNGIKSYDIITAKKNSHVCKCIINLPKWVLTTPKEISSHIFKMAIIPKFFEAFISNIIRWNTGKKTKLFSELFTNDINEYSFVLFVSKQSQGTLSTVFHNKRL